MICAASCVFLEGHLLKFIPCIWQVITTATVTAPHQELVERSPCFTAEGVPTKAAALGWRLLYAIAIHCMCRPYGMIGVW